MSARLSLISVSRIVCTTRCLEAIRLRTTPLIHHRPRRKKIPTNQTRLPRPCITITEPRLGHLRARREPRSHTRRSRLTTRSAKKSKPRSNASQSRAGEGGANAMHGERLDVEGRRDELCHAVCRYRKAYLYHCVLRVIRFTCTRMNNLAQVIRMPAVRGRKGNRATHLAWLHHTGRLCRGHQLYSRSHARQTAFLRRDREAGVLLVASEE